MDPRLEGIAIGGRVWLSRLVVGDHRERVRGDLEALQGRIGEPEAVYVRVLCQRTEKTCFTGMLQFSPGDHHREEIQNRLCLAVVEIATGEFINGWMITKSSPRSQTWRADRRMKVARDLLR
ncbi:hypothetical protein C362_06200 [Cryptococcus neoformans Bt1]|nr:hypothetical protein C362_06200 [Cryptococcus neoformans var. grubii Bt1]